MAQLFGYQNRSFLVQRLIDGGHYAHTHQGLNNISGFDSHTLGEVTYGDGFRNLYFSYHGLGWPLESMTLFFRFLFSPQLLARTVFFVVLGNNKRFFNRTAARAAMTSLFLLGLAFFDFVAALAYLFFLLLGLAIPSFIFRRRHGNVLRCRLGLLGFLRLGSSLFLLRRRGSSGCLRLCLFCSYLRCLFRRLLFRYRLLCHFFRLRCCHLRLGLQFRTLDIGAALAYFHVHGFCLAGLQRGCGFTLQGNLVRLCLSVTVGLSQISQQLLLLITGDSVVLTAGFQARFNDLLQQTIHGSAYICGQLFYRYFSHTGPPLPNQAWSSNQGARAIIIS